MQRTRHGMGRDTDRPERQTPVHRQVPGCTRPQAVRRHFHPQARSRYGVAGCRGQDRRRAPRRPAPGTADLPGIRRGKVATPSRDRAHHTGEVHLLLRCPHPAGVRPDADDRYSPRARPRVDHQDAGQGRLGVDHPVLQVLNPELDLHHCHTGRPGDHLSSQPRRQDSHGAEHAAPDHHPGAVRRHLSGAARRGHPAAHRDRHRERHALGGTGRAAGQGHRVQHPDRRSQPQSDRGQPEVPARGYAVRGEGVPQGQGVPAVQAQRAARPEDRGPRRVRKAGA